MKNLTQPAVLQQLHSRLASLTPTDTALWGSMSVTEMLCHLHEAFRLAPSASASDLLPVPMPRWLIKWGGLRAPMQWPHGVPTVPLLQRGVVCALGTFDFERDRLLAILNCFAAALPASAVHPIFGSMRPRDWARWGYLHVDHHLRQFGR